tara:strand:- start:85 stop:648 length:564 start_codon:yes stop_codon:yes gene_type:complete
MKESVGRQDQTWASYGGFNHIKFSKKNVSVSKVVIKDKIKNQLFKNLVVFFTGKSRFSNRIEKDKQLNIKKKLDLYHQIKNQVSICKKILINQNKINDIGYLLDEYWHIKKQLSDLVSPRNIDEIYKVGKTSGALGGKLLGSGGSGFMMFYCEKKNQSKLIKSLSKLQRINFESTNHGSRIIFNNEK